MCTRHTRPVNGVRAHQGIDTDTVDLTIETLSRHLVTREDSVLPTVLYECCMSVSSPDAHMTVRLATARRRRPFRTPI
eukprot:5866848-Pyramimonas_sp.AAC.1